MLGQALYKMLPTAGGIIRSFFCFWTLWKSPAEPCYCSVSYPEILSQCQNSFFTCLEKWGFIFSSVSPGARPVRHVVEVFGELRQVHTLLLRLRERLSCPLNTKQGMTLLWRLTMMIMMLVIKSSGTCSWTQVSSSAKSIRRSVGKAASRAVSSARPPGKSTSY